jgi:hypothetical protein
VEGNASESAVSGARKSEASRPEDTLGRSRSKQIFPAGAKISALQAVAKKPFSRHELRPK